MYAVVPYGDHLHQVAGILCDHREEIISCNPDDAHAGQYRTEYIVQQGMGETISMDNIQIVPPFCDHVFQDDDEREDAIENDEEIEVRTITGFDLFLHEDVQLPFSRSDLPETNIPIQDTLDPNDPNKVTTLFIPIRHIVEKVPQCPGYQVDVNRTYPFQIGKFCSSGGVSLVVGQTVTDIVRANGLPVYFLRIIRQKGISRPPNVYMSNLLRPFKQMYPDDDIIYCTHGSDVKFSEPTPDLEARFTHRCGRSDVFGIGRNYRQHYLDGLRRFISNIQPVEVKKLIIPRRQRDFSDAEVSAMTDIQRQMKLHWFGFTHNDEFIAKHTEVTLDVNGKGFLLKPVQDAPKPTINENLFAAGKNRRGELLWFRASSIPGFKTFFDAVSSGDISKDTENMCKPLGSPNFFSHLVRGYLNPRTKILPVKEFRQNFLWQSM